MSKCCVALMFPSDFYTEDNCRSFLLDLLPKFSRWSDPYEFRLLSRILTIQDFFILDLAIDMEGFSEDFIKKYWTEHFGLEPKEGYGFAELDDDEDLRLSDWGKEIIWETEAIEYDGKGRYTASAKGGEGRLAFIIGVGHPHSPANIIKAL